MQIHCPSCRSKVPAEDVNLERVLARCRGCQSVFDFGDQVGRGPAARPPAPLPARFRLDDEGRQVSVSWRWFTPKLFFLAFFCAAWDSFLVFWYHMAFATGAPWIMKVFPVAHLAVGAGLTYATLAGFWNRTTVAVSPEGVSVRHAPLPWAGNRTLPAAEIAQVYCQEEAGGDASTGGCSVNAVTRDGRKVRILSGLEEGDQALFLEQLIESRLGIEDRPVAGELRR